MRKYIQTHEACGTRYGNAYIIADHYSHHLGGFLALIAEAKRAFPELIEVDIECRTVIESSWCKGCPVIRFRCEPDTAREGWHNCERIPDVYF